jgi:hypothetical protein
MRPHLLFLAFLLSALMHGVQAQEPFGPITSFGNEYLSACAPIEIKKLKRTVLKLAEQSSNSAWQLTYALLCGVGKQAERLALSHMPIRITSSDSSTGDDDPDHPQKSYVARDIGLMRKGRAWDANAMSLRPNEITIMFTSNEVCVGSFSLRLVAGSWLLVETGSACD